MSSGYLIVFIGRSIRQERIRYRWCTFKQGSATGHKSINPGVVSTTNFVLIYAKNKSAWALNTESSLHALTETSAMVSHRRTIEAPL